jgi:hypothetical protein
MLFIYLFLFLLTGKKLDKKFNRFMILQQGTAELTTA